MGQRSQLIGHLEAEVAAVLVEDKVVVHGPELQRITVLERIYDRLLEVGCDPLAIPGFGVIADLCLTVLAGVVRLRGFRVLAASVPAPPVKEF